MEITQNITLINQLHDKYIISRSAHDALGASKFQLRLAEQHRLFAKISRWSKIWKLFALPNIHFSVVSINLTTQLSLLLMTLNSLRINFGYSYSDDAGASSFSPKV